MWPPTDRVLEVPLLPEASVNSMLGKCVACGSVVVVVSPSSCSFLLKVDDVINKIKTSQARPCDHVDAVFTLALMNMCSDYRMHK